MADGKENMQFEMVLDIPQFKKDWTKWEKSIQTVIDQSKFHIKLDIDKSQLNSIKATLNQLQGMGAGIGGKPSTQAAMLKAQLTGEAQAANIRNNSLNQGNLILERTRGQLLRNETAEVRLNAAKTRGIAATHTQNQAYQAQRGVMNGLPQMMSSYISVLGALSFVRSIKDITGEFELQRVALGAIIQDAERARMLFNQIKIKAIESPFMVKDMVTYTKQLAAFKVETEDLYGTMNMLADVSAGLGVGMDRLILAYGQVKAASVLRGQELRQFTEAGIPLVQLLADKFTLLNGEATSTGDVFKLISKRAVPFEMVKEIFEDMTSAGGSFFNMQEIQAKTISGLWNNLTDAFQIMKDEMGRDNRGVLAGIPKTLRELALNWRTVTAVMTPAIAALIMYNAVMAISNRAMGSEQRLLERLSKLTVVQTTEARLLTRVEALQTAGRIAASKATMSAAFANNFFTRSFYLLKAAMLTLTTGQIIGAILTIITLVGTAIYSITSFTKKAARMNKEIADTSARIKASADLSVYSLNQLVDKLHKATAGTEEYKLLIEELNTRYSEFLPNQIGVSDSYDVIDAAAKKATASIMAHSKAKAYDAGIQLIEGDYEDKTRKAYESALSGLTSEHAPLKFTQEQGAAILQSVSDSMKNNPQLYKTKAEIAKLLQEMVGGMAKATGQKGLSSSAFSKTGFYGYVVGDIAALSSELGLTAKKISAFERQLSVSYNTTDNQSRAVKNLTDKYAEYKKVLGKNGSVEVFNMVDGVHKIVDAFALETMQLNELIKVYKYYKDIKGVKTTEKLLEKRGAKGLDWESLTDTVTKGTVMIPATSGASIYKREAEGQDIFEYIKFVREEYDKVIEKQKLIKDNSKIKVPASDIKDLKEQKAAGEAIAKMLNFSLKDKKDVAAGLKAESDLLKDILDKYGNKIDLIERYTKVYEKLLALTGDEKKSAEMALSITGLNMKDKNIEEELRTQVADMFTKLPKLSYTSSASMESLRDQIGKLDPNGKEFKSAESALNALSDYMAETKVSAIELEKKIAELQGEDFMLTGSGSELEMSKITLAATKAYAKIAEERKTMETEASAVRDRASEKDKAAADELYAKQMMQIANIYNTKLTNEEMLTKDKVEELNWKDFQNLGEYAAAFEDMGRVGSGTLAALAERLQEMVDTGGLSVGMLMLIGAQLKKIRAIQEQKENPFESITSGVNEFIAAVKAAKTAKDALDEANANVTTAKAELKQAENKAESFENGEDAFTPEAIAARNSVVVANKNLTASTKEVSEATKKHNAAEDALKASLAKTKAGLEGVASTAKAFEDVLTGVAGVFTELFGDNEFSATLTDLAKGFGLVATMAGVLGSVVSAVGVAMELSLLPVVAVIAAIAVVAGAVFAIVGAKARKAEKAQGALANSIDRLQQKYEKLQKAAEELFGADYVKNMNLQIAALRKMAEEARKQAALEHSLATAKAKEYLKQAADYEQQAKDLEADMMNKRTGYSSIADAASDFASAWLDAYLSFAGTADAMKAKFKDMINTMIVDSLLAKMIAIELKPVFDLIDAAVKIGSPGNEEITIEELKGITDLTTKIPSNIESLGRAIMDSLGIKEGSGNAASTTLTGMSASVAGMSEDAAKTMGAYLNSGLMQWIQQTKLQTGMNGTLTDLYALQNQALMALNAIKQDTGKLVDSNSELVSTMKSVLSGTGAKSMRVQLV